MYFTIRGALYFYSLVAIAVIFYDLKYILSRNKENDKHDFLVSKYTNEYNESVKLIKENKNINKKYNKRLVKELSVTKNLLAFNDVIESKKDTDDFEIYRNYIYDIFVNLSTFYNKKSDKEKALFVYIIGNLNIDKKDNRNLDNIILSFLDKPSVYLVENIFKSFVILGHKDKLVKAIDILNLKNIYHNDKLISDGLLEYKGDKLDLAKELWKYSDKWMVCYVKAVIKFIRTENYDFKEEFYYALTKENLDIEIRIELLRYFARVKYDKVLEYLLEVIQTQKNIDINFLIVTATTLRNYPSKRTIEILKKGMTNSNWYIRKNSCASFLALNPSKDDIDDILNGHDRYAKDILLYQLERRDK